MRTLGLLLALALLAGCAAPKAPSPPPVAPPPPVPALPKPAGSMVQLKPDVYALLLGEGAGLVLTDGVAVTVGANRAVIDPARIFAETNEPHLVFFAADRRLSQLPESDAAPGAAVTVHGQSGKGGVWVLSGTVRPQGKPAPGCTRCDPDHYFSVKLEAAAPDAKGDVLQSATAVRLLGAPVLDGKGGIVGIVSGVFVLGGNGNYVEVSRLAFVHDQLARHVSANPGDP